MITHLQVRNAAGELVGLMRGPFPDEWIAMGTISFVEELPFCVTLEPDYSLPAYHRHDLRVQWWARPTSRRFAFEPGYEKWPCLVTDLPIETLKRIRAFR